MPPLRRAEPGTQPARRGRGAQRDEGRAPDDPLADVCLLRTEDLLVARLSAPGCTLQDSPDGPRIVAGSDDASLVLTLPPQHLGEHAYPEGGAASGRAAHRAAEPSRLVFALVNGQSVPFTLDGVLATLPTLKLRVAAHATPAPQRADAAPAWTDSVLVAGWRSLVEGLGGTGGGEGGRAEQASLAGLVLGRGQQAAHASTPLGREAASVLQQAGSARLLHGVTAGELARVVVSADPDEAEPDDPARTGPRRTPGARPADLREALGGLLRPGRIDLRPLRRGPRPPTEAETSLEVPYRLQVSPSPLGAFTHPVQPLRAPADETRTQLWRTRLAVRVENPDGTLREVSDADEAQRIVRAVWSRDLDALDATADADPAALEPQSMNPTDRRAVVRQTADQRLGTKLRPIQVRDLQLSSLGAWVDWQVAWEGRDFVPAPAHYALPDSYRHQAIMGRDQYVRLTYPLFAYPWGHLGVWIKTTQRKVVNRADATAYLWQEQSLLWREPVRTYGGHDSPWSRLAIEPVANPLLDPRDGAGLKVPFVPTRGGVPVVFTLVATDRAGHTETFEGPLVVVPFGAIKAGDTSASVQAAADALYAPHRRIDGRGHTVSFAREATGGDTAAQVAALQFRGEVDLAALSSRPVLTRTTAVVPSMRHLSPQAPPVDLVYPQAFLGADDDGFGAGNPSQSFLRVAAPPPAIDFSGGSERSGGMITPNLMVRGLSRTLGAVGDDVDDAASGLASGSFDAKTFLAGALPKLFGLFSLVDLLSAVGVDLDEAPSFVTEALDTVSAIASSADRLKAAAQAAGPRLDEEIARAAHDGAAAGLHAAKAQLDALLGPLGADLDTLIGQLGGLVGAPDPVAAAQQLVATLQQAATDADALLAGLGLPQVPSAVRAALQKPAQALAALAKAEGLLDTIVGFVAGLLDPSTGVTARLEWGPQLHSWPDDAHPVLDLWPHGPAGHPATRRALTLAVEVRASASTPPSVDVSAELADFALKLLPGAELMALNFSRIGFRGGSSGKPEVDVVFGGIEFLGPLAFVDTLRRMIPFDGFADPPYVDVSPEGVVAGFDLALPNVGVGVFSLENISLGADARVPFLGDAVSVGFHFCSKESPFRLTVMCIGGGGWVELRAAPKGLVLLELGLEACACLSVDLGVASGSVSISVGVYLRLESDKGLLTAYFRIRGEVDVLGLISASITLELSLTYHFETGKLVGRASLVVEVEVLFFSASVEIVVERQLAGSKGDPVLAQIYPPAPDGTNADWWQYCSAFAAA